MADPSNPYGSPQTSNTAVSSSDGKFDPATLDKIEVVIKDAGQFWLAIIMCIVCSGIGSLIIGPWYLVRLMQWNSLAREFPVLLEGNVAHRSIEARFQSSKIKLILGIGFGVLIFLLKFCIFILPAMLLAN